ncbi:MAG TPA: hypothetical protein VG408_03075 [Actinomycetota bacterium]|nr:hypothetical protein [Actinomycetota bacterium]
MQLAEGGSRASDPSKHGFLSPGKAFALLLGVILLLGAAVFLLRPDDLPRGQFTYPANEAPTFELTDAEAIARFQQLHALFREGSMGRDAPVIDVAMTSDSPLRKVALDDIAQLRRDRVLDKSVFRTQSIEVVSNTTDEIVLLQHVVVDPRFVSERTGKNVSQSGPTLDRVRWILHQEDGTWKVFRAIVLSSEPIE